MGLLILALMMTGLLFICLYSMKRNILLRQRLEKISATYSRIKKDSVDTKHDIFRKTYITIARKILNYLHVLTIDTTKTFTLRLANVGWLSKNALIVFLSLQMISIFGAIFLGIALGIFVPAIASKSFLVRATLIVLMMWLGYRLPEWYLSRKTKAYRIQLRRSLLDFLELYLICIESGFGNDKALDRITTELTKLHPALCEQSHVLITELTIFPNRRDAWDNFAERTGIDEIKVIVQIIKQSEQLGTSIAQALRAQVEMFRSERLSYVEQKAMRLPTLLTLPLVIFIFPALLLVILGPAVLKAMQVLGGGTS